MRKGWDEIDGMEDVYRAVKSDLILQGQHGRVQLPHDLSLDASARDLSRLPLGLVKLDDIGGVGDVES